MKTFLSLYFSQILIFFMYLDFQQIWFITLPSYCLLLTYIFFSMNRMTSVTPLLTNEYENETKANNFVLAYEPVYLCTCTCSLYGPGSLVGIATELRARRSGIESRWRRVFPPVHTGPGAHPASCKISTGSFLGVKCGQGVLLTTHPLLVPRS